MSICKLTPSANHQIGKLCKEHDCYAITLNLKGGGCAGFEYDWGTAQVEDLELGDELVPCDLGNFVIGKHSVMFLIGTEVDYVRSLTGSNFEIRNPNAKSSCGCGTSISIDL
jgi:iron-sulfur cluster insertion protein